jgi:hypothetical protein
MIETEHFKAWSYAELIERANAPISKDDLEANYRRGYTDGYLAAINDLQAIWFLKRRERIVDALWNHATITLRDWQKSGGGFVLPPTFPYMARCVYCGNPGTEMDHIVPQSRGGSSDPENLVPSCRCCNSAKADRTPEEWNG